MNLPRFSVRNSLMVNLLSIFVVAAGILALMNMRREAFPTFSFDLVTVTAFYPGATPEEVEKLITRKIEDELKGVSDIETIQSTSAEGFCAITIEIDPDADDKPQVITDIQQAVDRVPDLPSDMRDKPLTSEIRTQDAPVVEVALYGEFSRKELQGYAELLEDQIEELPDVSAVRRGGWLNEEIWIELEPKKLKRLRVSINEVVQAVRSHDINIPGGTLDTGTTEFMIRTANEYVTPEEFDRIAIRGNDSGEILYLMDVGKARWAFEDATMLSRTDGLNAVRLIVVKKEKGDAIRMVDEVKVLVDQFKKDNNPDLQSAYINDMSFYVKRRLGILINNGWIGLVLVLLSLFLLLSRPVALWTMVGLPVAFCATIGIMSFFDVSINLISMFGLIMVLGIVVDDAIVVAENIYRYMEEGLPAKEAAIKGAQEVVKPITVTILTTCVAFLPLAFMTGIFGKFIRWIPIVVIITLIASLIECVFILPSHLADFGRTRKKATSSTRKSPFLVIQNFYIRILQALLNHRFIYAFGMIAFFGVGIFVGLKTIPIQMFPSHGIEIFFIRAEAPIGTSLEETARKFEAVEKLVAKLPEDELKNYVLNVGQIQKDNHDPSSSRGSHIGQIIVYLTPETSRERKTGLIMDEIREGLKEDSSFDRLWLDEVKPGPPQGKPVAIRIKGADFKVMSKIADEVKESLGNVEGTRDIRDDYEVGKDELRVVVDSARASMAQLQPADVAKTVRWAFQGELASTIEEGNEDIDVVVRLNEQGRTTKTSIENLYIQNPRGFHIPFHEVAKVERKPGITAIKHYDTKRLVTVTANVDPDTTTSMKVNQSMLPKLEELQKKYPGYILEAGGEFEDTQESLDALAHAGILASFMIFLILASMFNSLAQPLMVMLAIPFGLFAAIFALLIHGEPLSFLAFMGMIGLAGVIINDSIILIDFANKRRCAGNKRRDAIVQACTRRFRPVVLTSITTVLGLAPVAYGIGGKDPFLVPMALTIAWGIAIGTIMTLTVIPCFYAVIDDSNHWFQNSKIRRFFPKVIDTNGRDPLSTRQETKDSFFTD